MLVFNPFCLPISPSFFPHSLYSYYLVIHDSPYSLAMFFFSLFFSFPLAKMSFLVIPVFLFLWAPLRIVLF